jgi:hypothetical protein
MNYFNTALNLAKVSDIRLYTKLDVFDENLLMLFGFL